MKGNAPLPPPQFPKQILYFSVCTRYCKKNEGSTALESVHGAIEGDRAKITMKSADDMDLSVPESGPSSPPGQWFALFALCPTCFLNSVLLLVAEAKQSQSEELSASRTCVTRPLSTEELNRCFCSVTRKANTAILRLGDCYKGSMSNLRSQTEKKFPILSCFSCSNLGAAPAQHRRYAINGTLSIMSFFVHAISGHTQVLQSITGKSFTHSCC